MTSTSRQSNPLDPPLTVAWEAEPSTARISVAPQFNGRHVIVAAGAALTALDPSDGSVRWQIDVAADPKNLAVARDAALVSGFTDEGSRLVCVDGLGAVRWQQPDWHIATESLGRDGDDFIVLGRRTGDTAQMCRVLRSDTGAERLVFECGATYVPDRVVNGFVYSIWSSDQTTAGLFLYDLASKKTERLLTASHAIRSKPADSIVVVDTTDVDTVGELIAVDLTSRKIVWKGVGGDNVALAVDRGQLAAVESEAPHRFALTLREVATGRVLWKTDPLEAYQAQPIIAADWAGVSLAGRRVPMYDRASGRVLQTLEMRSLFPDGLCSTPVGLIMVYGSSVQCLRHAEGQ